MPRNFSTEDLLADAVPVEFETDKQGFSTEALLADAVPVDMESVAFDEETGISFSVPAYANDDQVGYLRDTQVKEKNKRGFFGSVGAAVIDLPRGLVADMARTPAKIEEFKIYGEETNKLVKTDVEKYIGVIDTNIVKLEKEIEKVKAQDRDGLFGIYDGFKVREKERQLEFAKTQKAGFREGIDGIARREANSLRLIEQNNTFLDRTGLSREHAQLGFLYDLGQAGSSIAQSIGLHALLPVIAPILAFSAQQAGALATEAVQKGATPDVAVDVATKGAISEGVLEGVGNLFFFKALPNASWIKRMAFKMVPEAVQEGSQTGAEVYIMNEAGLRQDTQREVVTQILYSAALGGIAGGAGGGVQMYLENRALVKSLEKKGLNTKQAKKIIKAVLTENNIDTIEQEVATMLSDEVENKKETIEEDIAEAVASVKKAAEKKQQEGEGTQTGATEKPQAIEEKQSPVQKRLQEKLHGVTMEREKREAITSQIEDTTDVLDFIGEVLAQDKDGIEVAKEVNEYLAEYGMEAGLKTQEDVDAFYKRTKKDVAELRKQKKDVKRKVVTETRAQETALKDELALLEKGMRQQKTISKDEISKIQKQVKKLIKKSGLGTADQSRFLAKIAEINTKEQLDKFFATTPQLFQEIKQERAKDAVVKRIKGKKYKGLDLPFREFLDGFLGQFDLKRRLASTKQKRAKTKAFFDMLKDQETELTPGQEKALLLAQQTTLDDMSLEEVQEIESVVDAVIHKGKIMNRWVALEKGRLMAERISEFNENLAKRIESEEITDTFVRKAFEDGTQAKSKAVDIQNASLVRAGIKHIQAYYAFILRPELMYEMMGLSKEFEMLSAAEDTKRRNMKVLTRVLQEVHKDIDLDDMYRRKHNVAGEKGFRGYNLMFIYAHSQNVNGRLHLNGSGYSDADISKVNAYLLKEYPEAAKAVDRMIDLYDTKLFEPFNEVHKELNGFGLVKENRYFPIQKLEGAPKEKGLVAEMLSRSYLTKAAPRSGETKARVGTKEAFREMDYFAVLLRNLSQVEHYKAFAKPIRDLDMFFSSPQVKQSIEKAFGEDWYKEVKQHLTDIALNGSSEALKLADKMFRAIRSNYAVTVLGLNLLTVSKQSVSLLAGAQYVGKAEVTAALAELSANPVEVIKFIDSKSIMMADRAFTQEREYLDRMRRRSAKKEIGGTTSLLKKLSDISMMPIQIVDKFTTSAVWLGAYNKEMGEHGNEKEAIQRADKAIRRTQPMGGDLYLPASFRAGEVHKMLTMFTNQLNQNFNLLYESLDKTAQKEIPQGKNVMNITMQIILPALLLGIITRGRLPEDTYELFMDIINQFAGGMYGVGKVTAELGKKYSSPSTPAGSMISDVKKVVMAGGDVSETEARALARIVGVLSGGSPTVGMLNILQGRPLGSGWEVNKRSRRGRR